MAVSLLDKAEKLAEKLQNLRLKMATAESCTGGWASQVLTSVSGSSHWFEGAIVSYSNDAKQNLLGVSGVLLEQYGAVSQPVVEQMALGVSRCLKVPVSLAISGVAGPGGGSEGKPVGTVHIAWYCDEQLFSKAFLFTGGREQVREQSVAVALSELYRLLERIDR